MLPTNSNYTKSKSYNDICNKNHTNINDEVGVQQLLFKDLKSLIGNCNISKKGNEISWIEKISPTNFYYIKSKSHSDN